MLNFTELYNRLPEEVRTALENQMQNPKWHPEGSVYNHIKLVFEDVQEMYPGDTDLLLVALFHDLGKLDTTEVKEDGHITSYGHENYATRYIAAYIYLYEDLNPDVDRIASICRNHMRAHQYESGQLKNAIKRQRFESHRYFNDIMKFQKSDSKRQGNG